MSDIFITKLPALLSGWLTAFPQAVIAETLSSDLAKKDEEAVFWLHMNEDRQQWMATTVAAILKEYQQAKIVVLANSPNHTESLYALNLGVRGYCHALSAPNVLIEIKTVIMNGGLWLGQEFLQRLIQVSVSLAGNQPEHVQLLLEKLTKREKEVAVEAAKGLSNKEIARILTITERTVKAHLAAIFERLGAKDRLQLALMLNASVKRQ